MSKKIVRYNGGTDSFYGCTEPTDLVIGEKYEVSGTFQRNLQTDYILKDIPGHFDSTWFDDVQS